MTIEQLRALGVKTDEGLTRCMNNEPFYFRMIGLALADGNFDRLRSAVENNDLGAAFEAAHALKGATGNVSLTPIYEPVCEMTELLRAKTPADYRPYLEKILSARAALQEIAK